MGILTGPENRSQHRVMSDIDHLLAMHLADNSDEFSDAGGTNNATPNPDAVSNEILVNNGPFQSSRSPLTVLPDVNGKVM